MIGKFQPLYVDSTYLLCALLSSHCTYQSSELSQLKPLFTLRITQKPETKATSPKERRMNGDYVLLCGVMWCQYRHEDSGWELLRALRSPDPDLSLLAAAILQLAEEFQATQSPPG
jgi:hypothetical protein